MGAIALVAVGLHVLVDVVSLHALDLACSEQIDVVLVLLAKVISVHHHSGMFCGEMILFIVFQLLLGQVIVELIVKDELHVLLQPLVGDKERGRASFQVRGHVVFLLQKFKLFVLVK